MKLDVLLNFSDIQTCVLLSELRTISKAFYNTITSIIHIMISLIVVVFTS